MSRLYHRDRSKKLRKEARTIPIPGHKDYGDGQDDGKYYRCWNCGMVCDVDRDELGGPAEKARVTPKSYTITGQYGETNASGHTIFTGEGYTTVRYEPDVNSGCPFCGTLNWRGDHP